MASSDWTLAVDSVGATVVAKGATAGATPPNGGGTFVYGFNSLTSDIGAVGLYTGQADFAPMAKGGSVRGALQRGLGNSFNFSPFLFIGLQSTSVSGVAYLLGLSDDDPHRIVLRKGVLSGGIPSGSPGSLGIISRSTATMTQGTWLHLRLDMVVNTNQDVVLKVLSSDLTGHAVTSPTWDAVAGMSDVIDDAIGVRTGTVPLVSGYAGFGFSSKDVGRRAYFDHLEILRQL